MLFTTARILRLLILMAIVVVHGTLFISLAHPVVNGLECYLAGIVFIAFDLWVRFNSAATIPQRLAREIMLNVVLIFFAFGTLSETALRSAMTSGTIPTSKWSLFLNFVEARPFDLWMQFLAVWAVTRLLIWAAEVMAPGLGPSLFSQGSRNSTKANPKPDPAHSKKSQRKPAVKK